MPAIRAFGYLPRLALLQTSSGQPGRYRSDEFDRRGLHKIPLLRLKTDQEGAQKKTQVISQQKTYPTAYEGDGHRDHLSKEKHLKAKYPESNISVFTPKFNNRPSKPSLGHRYHLHQIESRILLSGGGHGLV